MQWLQRLAPFITQRSSFGEGGPVSRLRELECLARKGRRKTQNENQHMILKIKTLFGSIMIICAICLMATVVPASASVVWSDDFSSGTPSGLEVFDGASGSSVNASSGQLEID